MEIRSSPPGRGQILCFASANDKSAFSDFVAQNQAWLHDYALFMAAKDAHHGRVWTEWDTELAARVASALTAWSEKLSAEIAAYKFWQFIFFRQWSAIRTDCANRGIRIMGDIPIYAAHDSADVWAHRDMFWLDEKGNPLKVSGVPPDYFSATGQLWGNPVYRWDQMKATGYRWWIDRVRALSTCLTWCVWTTSAGLRPTGKSRRPNLPRSTGSG